jgi:hypothetical protein
MVQFIASAPALEALSLSLIGWEDYWSVSSDQLKEAINYVSPPPLLTALEIECPFPTPVLEWFLLQSPRRIQVLNVMSVTEDNAEAVCTFVHEFGSTLEKLSVMCAPFGSYLPRDGVIGTVGEPQSM